MEPKSMNQRIRELKEQATRTAMWIGDPDAGELDAEKFAELIVRECAEVAMRECYDPAEGIKHHFGLPNDYRHFGVEE
jgi:hypothetical protein